MADETKKKSAPKKEGKPEGAAEKPAKAADETKAKKAPAAAAAPAGAAPAAEAPAAKPAEGAAPVAGSAPTAAELLADDMAGKKIVKAKGAKKHFRWHREDILANAFNNTAQVTITDMQGNLLGWSSAGRVGFKGSRKSTRLTPRSRWRRMPPVRRCPTGMKGSGNPR